MIPFLLLPSALMQLLLRVCGRVAVCDIGEPSHFQYLSYYASIVCCSLYRLSRTLSLYVLLGVK
jgi:hypothetical protein